MHVVSVLLFVPVSLPDISASVSVPDDKWLSTLEGTHWLDYIRYWFPIGSLPSRADVVIDIVYYVYGCSPLVTHCFVRLSQREMTLTFGVMRKGIFMYCFTFSLRLWHLSKKTI